MNRQPEFLEKGDRVEIHCSARRDHQSLNLARSYQPRKQKRLRDALLYSVPNKRNKSARHVPCDDHANEPLGALFGAHFAYIFPQISDHYFKVFSTLAWTEVSKSL